MTDNEIEMAILKRLYSGAFEPNVKYELNLHKFASELGVENRHIWEIYKGLEDANLVEPYAMGGLINITIRGILFCEENRIVEEKLIQHQKRVRTKLLDTADTIQKEVGSWGFIFYNNLCHKANIDEQDFHNNIKLLVNCGLLEWKASGHLQITSTGKETVESYREQISRLECFEKLKVLDGVTKQQRGHELEDLLSKVAKYEKWDVEVRVRSQGQETDVIMHVGTHYFFVSCKWEKEPVSPHEIELLESRVRSRATTNGGLFFSMSGFTDNCIKETHLKISSALILLFGPLDIENIFNAQKTLTSLLDTKLEQAMHHRKVLVDGIAK